MAATEFDSRTLHRTGEANPYLEGAYAPVRDEITADDLEVVGHIPEDLNGVVARNGPNPQFPPEGRYHWFDGDGMVHAVQIADGTATYRNRWIRTKAFERELEAGHALWTGVMEPLSNNPRDMPLKDTANTDLVYHNGEMLALWYLTGEPYALDPVTLETQGAEDFNGTLSCDVSAHAKVDERTGEMFFFDYGPTPPFMRYGVVGPDGEVSHLVDIDLPGPRLPHDMAVTANHAILMDLPLVNDPEAAAAGRYKIVFRRDMPARFGVIPRHGSANDLRWFEADPCYIYHTVNAWEEGDEIVLDLCRVLQPTPKEQGHPLARMLDYLRLDAQLYRYRFNLRTGTTHEEPLDDRNVEFPSVNLEWLGHPTRHGYTVHISPEKTLLFDGLVKYDLKRQEAETHWFGDGRWGSEAPFAPRPGATAEDDGYLLSFVYDQREDRSELQILHAQDLAAGPIGRILIPRRVPIGFHACWIDQSRLEAAVAPR